MGCHALWQVTKQPPLSSHAILVYIIKMLLSSPMTSHTYSIFNTSLISPLVPRKNNCPQKQLLFIEMYIPNVTKEKLEIFNYSIQVSSHNRSMSQKFCRLILWPTRPRSKIRMNIECKTTKKLNGKLVRLKNAYFND